MEKNNDNELDNFLWNLSGYKKKIISAYPVDGFHAKIIGVLLILVGLYATFAWTFFFQTVTDSLIIPIVAGIFMGIFILSFDRALIASMASGKSNMFALIFRLVLAFLLGVFLSQPMILKFYQPEIKREAEQLYLEKIQEQKNDLIALNEVNKAELLAQEKGIKKQLADKLKVVQKSETDFKEEMDGSGGTGNRGYAKISRQKEKIFDRHMEEYALLQEESKPKLIAIEEDIAKLNQNVDEKIQKFESENAMFGTLMQVTALESLMQKDESGSLKARYFLLSFILVLIELSALIAKLLFKTKNYRNKIQQIEEEDLKIANLEREISFVKLEQYQKHAEESDLALMHAFKEKSKEINDKKVAEFMNQWEENKESSTRVQWNMFLDRFMIQE